MEASLVKTSNNNFYLNSPYQKYNIYFNYILKYIHTLYNQNINLHDWFDNLPNEELILDNIKISKEDIFLYLNKYFFLREADFFKPLNVLDKYITELNFETINFNLLHTNHIIFEVTDACNLDCEYCAYGKYYNDYGERKNTKLSFRYAQNVIDYFANLFKTGKNISFNKIIRISFYGGEALMNIDIIKQIIEYIEKQDVLNEFIEYGMTTNGVLLDKHIDYLVKKKFHILVSLDGDKENSRLRIFKNGENSFYKIFDNLTYVRAKYPQFFESNIQFNSVIHKYNDDLTSLFNFFQTEFNKTAVSFAEISTHNIKPEKQDELYEIRRNVYNLVKSSNEFELITQEMLLKAPNINSLINIDFHVFIQALNSTMN